MRPLWMHATTSGDTGLWMDIRDSATVVLPIFMYNYEYSNRKLQMPERAAHSLSYEIHVSYFNVILLTW
jgi:hypothetical protein